MLSGQLCTNIEALFRHFYLNPQTLSAILFQGLMNALRLRGGHFAMEDVLRDRVRPLRIVQRSKPNAQT